MYFWRFWFIYALIETAMACPPNCICKWKGGKQTVECVNKSMITVPDGMDFGTQVLDFSGNNLKTLGSEQFQRLGLVNLQKVYLSRCRLTELDSGAFRALSNLVELDLSNNILRTVPVDIFPDLPSLMKLSLNGNPFKILKAFSFKSLKYLVNLELSRCELEEIDRDAFYGLSALEVLKLDFNSLRYIPGVNTIPKRLHGINLQHNPWFCDCKLADLFVWLNVSHVPQEVEPICDGPVRLRGAPIKLLDEQELACLPDVSPTSLYLEIPEGKNVSLLCRVNAVPEAKVSWRFQDRVLLNDSTLAPGVHLYYYVEEGTVEKRSELFIFNANVLDNGTFVCVAENQAGKAQSNYTIRIVLKEEPVIQVKRVPFEYIVGVCILSAILLMLALTCFVTCLLRYRVRRKRRRKKEKSKELALYGDGELRASPITRSGETLSTISDACAQKANGSGIFIADHPGILKMSSLVDASANVTPGSGCQLPHLFYPSCNVFTSDQNPDLINDTSKDRKVQPSNSSVEDKCLGKETKTGDPGAEKLATTVAYTADWPTSQTSTSVVSVPVNVCFNHFQQADLHLNPEKFLVEGYPTDYGLPKVQTHFPPILPATAFYRTLPHRRHNSGAAAEACNARYIREAEFLTRSMQPAAYEHFLSGDVRYNVEGYPKDSPSYTYTPHHVSFSDTVQILGKSSDSCTESEKKEHRIPISLINASAQTHVEDLQPEPSQNKKISPSSESSGCGGEVKLIKTPRLSVCAKNITDSPDEGYVGEGPDTTDV